MSTRKICLTGLLLILLSGYGRAQGGIEVTPTFRFADGVYLSYEAFQRNQPDLLWSDLIRRGVTNPETLITQVEYIKDKETMEELPLEDLWGICLEGLPFIRIPEDSIYKALTSFVGLRVAGNINYFSYENRIEKEYEIAAYNPLNGQPFRRATVKRPVTVFVEKIMDFETGQIYPFNEASLRQLMAKDPQLMTVLNELEAGEEEYEEQLFRLLMSFNRRHRVFFKPQK